MALAADDLFSGVVTTCFRLRSLDRLAVDHRRRWARVVPGPLTIQHQNHVVNGLEQKPPRRLSKPAIDRSATTPSGPAASACRTPNRPGCARINHLAKINLGGRRPGLGHQRRELLPLLVRQIRRVALGLLGPGPPGHGSALSTFTA